MQLLSQAFYHKIIPETFVRWRTDLNTIKEIRRPQTHQLFLDDRKKIVMPLPVSGGSGEARQFKGSTNATKDSQSTANFSDMLGSYQYGKTANNSDLETSNCEE